MFAIDQKDYFELRHFHMVYNMHLMRVRGRSAFYFSIIASRLDKPKSCSVYLENTLTDKLKNENKDGPNDLFFLRQTVAKNMVISYRYIMGIKRDSKH